jgi:hypothetical protein
MFIKKTALDRRLFLRGVGAALALPFLDAMTPAFASASKATPRMAFLYVPNGANMAAWTPTGAGKGFTFSPTLKALEPFREHVNVLSGLALHSADRLNDGAGDHSRATGAFLSGCHAKRTQGADLELGVTADQIAARVIGKDSLLPSLELGVDDHFTAALCDEGYTCAYSNTLSWTSSNTPLPQENDPRLVFERLFGEGGDIHHRIARLRENRSILDSVTGDMKQLQGTLGSPDRLRMDQYFEAIRQVELRLQRVEKQNAESPTMGAGLTRPLAAPDKFEDHIQLIMDLQVLAFQSDITRVTTLMFAGERSGRSYPQVGVPDSHHSVSHHENNPEKLAKVAKIDTCHIQQLAYFVGKLSNTPDGDSNLLENSMVLYGAGISNGNVHDHSPLPIVLCGGGGGQIQGGRHIVYQNEPPLSNILRGMLEKVGVHADKLGESTGVAEI